MKQSLYTESQIEYQTSVEHGIFKRRQNCWRITSAEHAALLVDCANFYSAIHEAISKAEHSIFILGWEIDSGIRLIRGEEEKNNSLPSVVLDLLSWKAKQNPNINIYLCRWDSSVVFVGDRELMPELAWASSTPENVHICADGNVPMGGSHHQKIIVIDDELVFTGGMDIARQRWDEREHRIVEPERTDVLGPYTPYHDVQVMMDGPVSADFAELARDRWRKGAGYEAIPIRKTPRFALEETVSSWPAKFPPVMMQTEVAISRTLPYLDDQDGVQEIRRMYFDLVEAAEKFIYIENQFLTCEDLARAINRRLKEKPDLKVLAVSSYDPQGIFERESLWAGRIDFKKILTKNIDPSRVRMAYPRIKDPEGKPVCKRIHSKVFVVDDRYMTVASSNLNNRSMILDSECDVTFRATKSEHRRTIAFLRHDLIAEHTGRTADQVREIMSQEFTLDDLLNAHSENTYSLQDIDDTKFTNQSLKPVVDRFADPKEPLMSVVDLTSNRRGRWMPLKNPRKHILVLAILALVAIAGLVVYLRNHAEWFQADSVQAFLEYARNSRFALPLVCFIYIVGGFILFPVTLLSLITAAVFGAIAGPLYGMAGSLASATVMFWLGNWAGLKGLRRFFGHRIRFIDEKFKKTGVLGVAALRLLPIAPYSLVNLAAGISSVRFFTFIAGTFIGFIPGLLAKGLVGDSLVQTILSPTNKSIFYLCLGIVIWLAVAAGSYFFAKKWQKNHPHETTSSDV